MNGQGSPPVKRQRASRKGKPRIFTCSYEGCEKRYSRAEHLARHQLNHNPKKVYNCDVEGCTHSFVRPDLFERHRKKHEEIGSSDVNQRSDATTGTTNTSNDQLLTHNVTSPPTSLSFNGGSTSTPLVVDSIESRWRQGAQNEPLPSMVNNMEPNPMSQSHAITSEPTYSDNHMNFNLMNNVTANQQSNDNFATWLFDSPGSHNSAFDFNNVPFLDFGMDFAPTDMWNFDDYSTGLTDLQGPRTFSSASITSDQRPDREPHLYIYESRRRSVLSLLSTFMGKKPPRSEIGTQPDSVLYWNQLDWPNLTVDVLEGCLSAFWNHISAQMPIVHQPTFSANKCQPYLLLSIIALGAAAIVRSQPPGMDKDYRALGDFVATNLRWDLMEHDHAEPPVHLWVAQTLLLLEHYEKLYSTRKLHERANIYHASTLTLLRRGSPMVGRSGSETPPSELPTRYTTPVPGSAHPEYREQGEAHSWWKRWVSNESMNRVVFAAFQMDTLHACMFGHSADLLPHELRLPLPCDDSLWNAKNAEEVRRLESTFAMYRIKPVNFLDGLKRCLHGYDVQTHSLGRVILMSGLLSVGWHINRREKNLQFVETVPSVQEQARWRSLLLQAFGHWRRSFDEVLNHTSHRNGASANTKTQDASDPTVLFHFAHLTMHVDIIDCQILTGPRRLIGRRVSDKDKASVIQRMGHWAKSAQSRHATFHAFKLLQATICANANSEPMRRSSEPSYSCRDDAFIYRPWILYLAGLTIWAHQFASSHSADTSVPPPASTNYPALHDDACQYISRCATTDNADRIPLVVSKDGCIAVLEVLSQDFANAESEILIEASKRLQEGIKMLVGTE